MGKRLIPRGTRKPKTRISEPTAADFGDAGESSESGDVSNAIEQPDTNSADEIDSGGEYTDPASLSNSGGDDSGGDASNTGGKRRGRRKGSRNKAAKTQTTITTRILYSIHAMGASFLKQPLLQVSEQEATVLAEAIQQVQEQYELLTLTPKQEAWINLAVVAAGVYGPRVAAIVVINKTQKQAALAQQAQQATVFQMPDLETIKNEKNKTSSAPN